MNSDEEKTERFLDAVAAMGDKLMRRKRSVGFISIQESSRRFFTRAAPQPHIEPETEEAMPGLGEGLISDDEESFHNWIKQNPPPSIDDLIKKHGGYWNIPSEAWGSFAKKLDDWNARRLDRLRK